MLRILPTFLILISLVPIGMAWGSNEAIGDFMGHTVVEISQQGSEMSEQEFRALMPFQEGDVLNLADIRNAIKNLFRTGLFDGVEVLGRGREGGVEVLFRVTPKRWLNEVLFVGNLRLSDNALFRKIDLGREEELTADGLERNRQKILDYYSYRGFLDARISFHTEAAPHGRTDVVFEIEEGARRQIDGVDLTGDPGMSRAKFLTRIASMPGEVLDGVLLDKDVGRITSYFRDRGFYYPKVSYTVEPHPRDTEKVLVSFLADRGTHYDFKVKVHPQDGKTERQVKWIRNSFLKNPDPQSAMEKAAERIRRHYLSMGHPFVSLEWEDEGEGTSSRRIALNVDAGFRAVIGRINIEGVESIPMETVHQVMGFKTGDPFVRQDLEKSMDNVREVYRSQGYLDTSIFQRPLEFIQVQGDQQVDINLSVEEGPQTLIGEIHYEGKVYNDEAREILNVRTGDPLVPEQVEKGVLALQERLSDDGYLFGSVPFPERIGREDGKVDLRFRVEEGPKVRLGSVVIIGGEQVENRIIRRAIDMRRGDLITIEKILEAQRRVYALGVHTSVEIRVADQDVPAPVKDLVVEVTERPRYAIGLRLGYGSEDKGRMRFSVTNRNFAGMARSLIFGLRLSDIEEMVSLTYLHPWFLAKPIEFSASLIDLLEERESFTRDTLGVLLAVKRELSRRSTFRLQYSFDGLELSDVSPDAKLSPEDEGATDVASVIPEFLYDSRDDFFDPTTGILGDLRIEIAASELGSQAEFYKVEGSLRKYISFGRRLVLAGLLRAGVVKSYGISEEVIISERFFLGGQNSVRGYGFDELGPLDSEGDPIGGNNMINLNLELRFPIFGSLGGVLFLDSGALWLNQAPYDDTTLRATGGTGFRWSSPIGPLSLDYGHKLNPATDVEEKYRVHFSIGHAF
jgi:outer membrane protein assembly complex protein YaeT